MPLPPRDSPLGPLNDSFKFFLAHLSFHTTPTDVRQHFSSFGQVNFVKIIFDPKRERSRGFGFLYMYDAAGDAAVYNYAVQNNFRIELGGRAGVNINRHDPGRAKPIFNPKKTSHDEGIPTVQLGAYQPSSVGTDGGMPQQQYSSYQPQGVGGSSMGTYGSADYQQNVNHMGTGPPSAPLSYASNAPQAPQTPVYNGNPPTQGYSQGSYAADGYSQQGYDLNPVGQIAGNAGYGPSIQADSSSYGVQTTAQSSQQAYGYQYGNQNSGTYGSSSTSYSTSSSYAPGNSYGATTRNNPYGNQDSYAPQQQVTHGQPAAHKFVYIQNLPKACQPKEVVSFLSRHDLKFDVKRCIFDYSGSDVLGAHVELSHFSQVSQIISEGMDGRLVMQGLLLSVAVDQYPPPTGSSAVPGSYAVSSGPPTKSYRREDRARGRGSRSKRRDRPY